MSRLRSLLAATLLAGTAGCGGSSAEGREQADAPSLPDRLAASIQQAVSAGETRPGCDRPSPGSPPQAAIAITAEHCLNCLEVGGLLRGAEQDARRAGRDLRVVFRADEADEICPFLKREKVRLSVDLVPPERFPGGKELGELVYVEFGAGPVVQRVLAAQTGVQLLEEIRGSNRAPSATARTQSR